MDENFHSSEVRNNPDNVSRILAKQKPNWPPGSLTSNTLSPAYNELGYQE